MAVRTTTKETKYLKPIYCMFGRHGWFYVTNVCWWIFFSFAVYHYITCILQVCKHQFWDLCEASFSASHMGMAGVFGVQQFCIILTGKFSVDSRTNNLSIPNATWSKALQREKREEHLYKTCKLYKSVINDCKYMKIT